MRYHEDMERKFEFEPDCYYHIYNRGVEKRTLFIDDNDRRRFQHLLYLANGRVPIVFKRVQGDPLDKVRGESRATILAYSLMSNHFHVVAREDERGGLSGFVAKLSTAYSMYFNTKNERSGTLLCRPFRAKHIADDDYFRWVMSYVHLNPLDLVEHDWKVHGIKDVKKATDFLRSYKYSSYPDYFGSARAENKIVEKAALPIDVADLESFDTMLAEFSGAYERPDIEIW